jgi:hypothetical protein
MEFFLLKAFICQTLCLTLHVGNRHGTAFQQHPKVNGVFSGTVYVFYN